MLHVTQVSGVCGPPSDDVLSASNLQLYLPVILQEIEARPRRHAVPPAALAQGGEGEHGGSDGEGRERGRGKN